MKPFLLDLRTVRIDTDNQVSQDIHRVSVSLVFEAVPDLRTQKLLDSALRWDERGINLLDNYKLTPRVLFLLLRLAMGSIGLIVHSKAFRLLTTKLWCISRSFSVSGRSR